MSKRPEPGSDDALKLLRSAWDDMLEELARARDAIDQPGLMPAPPSDRNLAEGYRYLMGFVHSAVERAFFEDPKPEAAAAPVAIVSLCVCPGSRRWT